MPVPAGRLEGGWPAAAMSRGPLSTRPRGLLIRGVVDDADELGGCPVDVVDRPGVVALICPRRRPLKVSKPGGEEKRACAASRVVERSRGR
jgi:hypothetical protein